MRERACERERWTFFIRAKTRTGGYFLFARLPAKDPLLKSFLAVARRHTVDAAFSKRRGTFEVRKPLKRKKEEEESVNFFTFFDVVVVVGVVSSERDVVRIIVGVTQSRISDRRQQQKV